MQWSVPVHHPAAVALPSVQGATSAPEVIEVSSDTRFKLLLLWVPDKTHTARATQLMYVKCAPNTQCVDLLMGHSSLSVFLYQPFSVIPLLSLPHSFHPSSLSRSLSLSPGPTVAQAEHLLWMGNEGFDRYMHLGTCCVFRPMSCPFILNRLKTMSSAIILCQHLQQDLAGDVVYYVLIYTGYN